jgi:DNA-binding response OmpR family regulator
MVDSADTDRTMRVMVVDDDTDSADVLAALLKTWGYDARVAYTGSFSLKVATEFQPEVFLVDLGMGHMDGFSLAENIRNHPTLGRATLVAVTGYGDESHRTRSKQLGFAHFFVKPIDLVALEAVLRGIDRRRSVQVEAEGENG